MPACLGITPWLPYISRFILLFYFILSTLSNISDSETQAFTVIYCFLCCLRQPMNSEVFASLCLLLNLLNYFCNFIEKWKIIYCFGKIAVSSFLSLSNYLFMYLCGYICVCLNITMWLSLRRLYLSVDKHVVVSVFVLFASMD